VTPGQRFYEEFRKEMGGQGEWGKHTWMPGWGEIHPTFRAAYEKAGTAAEAGQDSRAAFTAAIGHDAGLGDKGRPAWARAEATLRVTPQEP